MCDMFRAIKIFKGIYPEQVRVVRDKTNKVWDILMCSV
jgi:hypothetical protein